MLTNASYSFFFSILCLFVCLIVFFFFLSFFFFFFFFFFGLVCFCFETRSHFVAMACFKFTKNKDTPPSATWVLGLKACTTW